jgi:O-antigen/teichoic acid export membrane protein
LSPGAAEGDPVKHWFRDGQLRSLLRNCSYLAGSQSVAALAGIATAAFTARTLGLHFYGTLVLIASYAQLINGFSKFQSWQMVVRYGGQALAREDPAAFKSAVGFAIGLDFVSGFGGMAIGIALLPLIGPRFGLPPAHIGTAMLYCTLLPTMASATPTGVLRALQRFALLSWEGTIFPILRALLAGIAWTVHAPLDAFVLIWWLTNVGNDLTLWWLAWRELRRAALARGIRPSLRPSALAGAWRFAIYTNLNASLLAVAGPLSRLIVGGLVGPAGAGLYRVALNLSDAVRGPANLLLKAYYPQVVALDFQSKKPWRLMVRIAALASIVALVATLVLLVGGRPIIAAIFGKQFIAAYQPLLILCVAAVLSMLNFPLAPTLYSLDRPEAPAKARLTGTAIHFILIVPLIGWLGLDGAALAYLLGYAISMALMMLSLFGEYRRVRLAPST